MTIRVHAADAHLRAPVLGVDTQPLAVVMGSIEDPDIDISPLTLATFLQDGRFIATSFARRRIFTFSPDGRERVEVGERGAGPSDFGTISTPIAIEGNAVLVSDGSNDRVALVDPTEGVISTHPFRTLREAGGSQLLGLAGGHLLAAGRHAVAGAGRRTAAHIVQAPIDGGPAAVLYRDTPVPVAPGSRAMQAGTADRRLMPGDLMSGERVVWTGGAFVLVDLDRWTFSVVGPDGTFRHRAGLQRSRVAISPAMWEAHLAEAFDSLATTLSRAVDSARVRTQLGELPIPDSLPAIERVAVSPAGVLWLVEARVPGLPDWAAVAFDGAGRLLGRITGTTGDPPALFGDDRVLFRTEDEFGIARWAIHRLRWPTSPNQGSP